MAAPGATSTMMRSYGLNLHEEIEVGRDIYAFNAKQLSVRMTLPITKCIRSELMDLQKRIVTEEGGFLDRSVLIRSMIRALLHHFNELGDKVSFEGIDTEAKLVEQLKTILKSK